MMTPLALNAAAIRIAGYAVAGQMKMMQAMTRSALHLPQVQVRFARAVVGVSVPVETEVPETTVTEAVAQPVVAEARTEPRRPAKPRKAQPKRQAASPKAKPREIPAAPEPAAAPIVVSETPAPPAVQATLPVAEAVATPAEAPTPSPETLRPTEAAPAVMAAPKPAEPAEAAAAPEPVAATAVAEPPVVATEEAPVAYKRPRAPSRPPAMPGAPADPKL